MPFIQRCLEPIYVSRVEVEKGIKNELECVTNHTLSNIILQLSSLSKHAEDMFTELSIEVKTFTDRSQHLQWRIDHLREKVTRLDAAAGTLGSIHELHLKKPFKSSTIYDQQVVSRSTLPKCILKAYNQCDPTPALNKLSHYRDDGRDSLKFYTDPGYFFELWFLDIQKDMENKKIELELKSRKKKKPKSETSQGKKPRIVQTKAERFKKMQHGVEFIQYANPTEIQAAAINKQLSLRENQRKQGNVPYDQKDTRLPQCTQDVSNHTNSGNNKHEHKIENSDHQKTPMHHSQLSSKLNVAEKYSSGSIYTSKSLMPPPNPYPDIVNELHYSPTRDDLPPPPPPPLSEVDYPRRYASKKIFARVSTALWSSPEKQEDDFPLPPFPSTISPEPILTIPPAPQAPQPPPINTKMVPTNAFDKKNSSVQAELLLSLKRKSTRRQSALVGGGSNFLEQIRGGIHLRHLDDIMKRKVNENEKGIFKKSTPDGNFDVHSIMNRAFEMRRKVIERSDEEDGSSDDDWD